MQELSVFLLIDTSQTPCSYFIILSWTDFGGSGRRLGREIDAGSTMAWPIAIPESQHSLPTGFLWQAWLGMGRYSRSWIQNWSRFATDIRVYTFRVVMII